MYVYICMLHTYGNNASIVWIPFPSVINFIQINREARSKQSSIEVDNRGPYHLSMQWGYLITLLPHYLVTPPLTSPLFSAFHQSQPLAV